MSSQSTFLKLSNPFMKAILRSPLHGMISGSTMIVTVTGRKSGKRISTPVNYLRTDQTLSTLSFRNRMWWRNLRSGGTAMLRLQGRDVEARAEIIEDDTDVAASLTTYLQQAPKLAKYLGVALDANGQPNPAEVVQAAATRVMIHFHL